MCGDVHFFLHVTLRGLLHRPHRSVPGSSYPHPRYLSGPSPAVRFLCLCQQAQGLIGSALAVMQVHVCMPTKGPVHPLPKLASLPQERLTEEGRCRFSACSPPLSPQPQRKLYTCVHSNYSFTSRRGAPLLWGERGGGGKKDVCKGNALLWRLHYARLIGYCGLKARRKSILWHR